MCTKIKYSEVEVAAAIAQAFVVGAIMASIAASVFNGSTPGGLFQIINFMQFFMFLVLLNVYLPKKIEEYIQANDEFNFNFGIPGLRSIPVLKNFLDIFKIVKSNEVLQSLNVEYQGTFYNTFSHLVLLMMTV